MNGIDLSDLLDGLTTDQLWKSMPPFVHYQGDDYFFGAIRGNKREIVTYQTKSGKSLFSTYRGDKSLSEALRGWLHLLIDNDLLSEVQLRSLISKL